MKWIPVSSPPICDQSAGFGGYKEARPILVWVDARGGYCSIGRCVCFGDNDYQFSAYGHNGDWKITHWAELTRPEGL